MLKVMFVLFVLVIASAAHAGTDYQCVNDCTAKGYMYNYCTSRCSYDNNPYQQQQQPSNPYQVTPIPQTDFKCLNDCTNKGYMYSLCKERCSY